MVKLCETDLYEEGCKTGFAVVELQGWQFGSEIFRLLSSSFAEMFDSAFNIFQPKVDMSGMRALLVASIVAVVSACELKQFNDAAGHF